jgi:AraC family transcriptional regulator
LRNAPQKKNATKPLDYADRINRAINFVLHNLQRPIRLEEVARVACFSPFHFHRIFRLLSGEPLNEFVKRVRLERALAMMSRRTWKTKRHLSLTDIAFATGFTSSADFARSFKQRYGVPPSRFDVASYRANRREEWQIAVNGPAEAKLLDRLKPDTNPDNFAVHLRRLPARGVAYMRVLDSFRPGAVFEVASRLVRWAEARGLADGQWLGYMWDDPEITASKLCRYDVAVEVNDVPSGPEVSYLRFPAMEVAEVKICGSIELELRALDWLYGTWLPGSGYVPAEQPGFEAFIGRPFAHGTDYFEFFVQLPVTRG